MPRCCLCSGSNGSRILVLPSRRLLPAGATRLAMPAHGFLLLSVSALPRPAAGPDTFRCLSPYYIFRGYSEGRRRSCRRSMWLAACLAVGRYNAMCWAAEPWCLWWFLSPRLPHSGGCLTAVRRSLLRRRGSSGLSRRDSSLA